jgi:hypothetical protein
MKRAEPGWLVLAIAGIAALIGSFLPFYTFGRGVELTVWNRSLFPTATLIPLLVFGIGLEGLFVLLMGYEPRSPFLSFTWSQARLAGTAFAIVLALSYLVQGRAGGSLGSGYVILSLSAVASFAGAVVTRRAELARGREEITVPAEHPWRAAFLRWRRELTAKVNSYAAGGREPAQPSPPTETMPSLPGEEPDGTSEIETPEPTPVPRLSAVQSEPEPKEEPAADGDEPTTDGDKAAADEETAGEGEAAPDGDVAVAAAAETETETQTEAAADDKAEGETEDDDEEPERERPAAPG